MALCSDLSDIIKPADPYFKDTGAIIYQEDLEKIDGSTKQISEIINE